MCENLHQTVKLGLLDSWRWDRQLCPKTSDLLIYSA